MGRNNQEITVMINKNPERIKKLFNEISDYYDNMNNIISLGLHKVIKTSAVKLLDIKKNSIILDLCCGTGDITKIVNKKNPSSKVIGVDSSYKMIEKAKIKNPDNLFVEGDCTCLPFKDNEFDYTVISFGLRNIEDRTKAITEIYRVLKERGYFLHLDFGEHNFQNRIFDFLLKIIIFILPFLKENYEYLIQSKNDYPVPNELIWEFQREGFILSRKRDYLFGVITVIIMQKP